MSTTPMPPDTHASRRTSRNRRWGASCAFLVAAALLGSCGPWTPASDRAKLSRVKNDLRTVQAVLNHPDSASWDSYSLHDPFVPKQTLRFRVSDGVVYMYSVGPDKVDDGGRIAYDATNGAVSAGDVVRAVYSCSGELPK